MLANLELGIDTNELLALDVWSGSLEGQVLSQKLMRLNLQLGMILTSTYDLVSSGSDKTQPEISSLLVTKLAKALSAEKNSILSKDIINEFLTGVITEIASDINFDTTFVASLAQSIENINILLEEKSLNPTNRASAEILSLSQYSIKNIIEGVLTGSYSLEQFSDSTSIEKIFKTSSLMRSLLDTDEDGFADVIDVNDDNDALSDLSDAFPLDKNETLDTDADGTGNNADTDDDADGVVDTSDAFPLDKNETLDTDADGTGNNADTDDDADGVEDTSDAFPLDKNETLDTDADGTGNNADTDDDGDGVVDTSDVFPLDKNETLDTDADGTGNNADTDDDDDGVIDTSDAYPLNKNVHTAPVATASNWTLNLLPKLQNTGGGTLSGTAQDSRSLTYTIVGNATNGVASISDSSSGAFSYQTISGVKTSSIDSFTFKVNDGFVDSSVTAVSISLQTDPLYQHQWHLDNTGQLNFASTVGTASKDINVDSVINEGYTGNNVIVAIVDSGLEIAHEDLTQNIVVNGSYNFLNNSTDPTNASTTGDHGTSVTGIIGARGWNKIGGRGIAPKASLKGFNMLKAGTYANVISSLGGAAYSSDVDVFNLSYGYESDYSFLINSSLKAQYIDGITNLRSGKGAIYVASGGNGFLSFGDASCAAARENGVSCQNVSMDPEQSIPYVIVVGALSALGTKASYSTAGSAFWISAPGGEYGEDINYGDYGGPYTPAIMTTDQSTCDKGYVRSNQSTVVNAFNNKGNHSENTACNYTSTFNGTSSAAPVAAGAIALLLEANPNLTWRDIKHILAVSATQVDANIEAKVIDEYIAEPAWTTNAAGYKFHNWYGFGGIDVAAALTLAKNYTMGSLGTFVTSTEKTSGTLNTSIPDDSNTGVANAINDSNNLTIEAINAYVCLSHDRPSDLSIALSSPQGTRSVLLPPFNGFDDVSDCFNIISNMFYGENSNGNWTIKIVDKKSGTTGSIGSWKLTVFGR